MLKNLVFSFGVAGILRLFLLSSNFADSIRNRIEVSTPLNSWKRRKLFEKNRKKTKFLHIRFFVWVSYTVKEGAFLYDNGIDPYAGDIYHESPLFLYLSSFLLRNFNSYIPYFFVGCDLLSAFLLYRMARTFVAQAVIDFIFIYSLSFFYQTFVSSFFLLLLIFIKFLPVAHSQTVR